MKIDCVCLRMCNLLLEILFPNYAEAEYLMVLEKLSDVLYKAIDPSIPSILVTDTNPSSMDHGRSRELCRENKP